ncbi:MAG: potassium-transporting ATPase subunit KdpC [Ignavibacteriales bacterium]|nr:potassium-transporting ATPase subunit KdpC [Ignavibacteriales bacterium]
MKLFLIDLKLHFIMVVLVGCLYPLLILGLGYFARDAANGFPIRENNKIVGYKNIGQKFTSTGYFWGRPSAVDYNAASSGGTNKSTTNADYLQVIAQRKVDFLLANPSAVGKEIPSDIVTASGSGLDPHISVAAALLQVQRVAAAREIAAGVLETLIQSNTERPPAGLFGAETVNVLELNLALDKLKNH